MDRNRIGRQRVAYVALAALLMTAAGCSLLGIGTPENLKESIFVADASVNAAADTVTVLANGGKLDAKTGKDLIKALEGADAAVDLAYAKEAEGKFDDAEAWLKTVSDVLDLVKHATANANAGK